MRHGKTLETGARWSLSAVQLKTAQCEMQFYTKKNVSCKPGAHRRDVLCALLLLVTQTRAHVRAARGGALSYSRRSPRTRSSCL